MSVAYLPLYRGEENVEDLFEQAARHSKNDDTLQRKIAGALPYGLVADRISTAINSQLALKISRLQGELDDADPQQRQQRKHVFSF